MHIARFRGFAAALVGLVALLAALVLPGAGTVAAQTSSDAVVLGFEGTVTRGPSKGVKLDGVISLIPQADGTLSGALRLEDGTEVPTTAQLAGGNIAVTFSLDATTKIFGIGNPNEEGGFSGFFVGPAEGDRGRWKSEPVTTARFNFSGTVQSGTNAGVTLAGPLVIAINPLEDNAFTGTLTVDGIGEFPVTGELIRNGRGIDITFDASVLGADLTIEGHGTRTSDGGYRGGFDGPADDDEGTWTATPA